MRQLSDTDAPRARRRAVCGVLTLLCLGLTLRELRVAAARPLIPKWWQAYAPGDASLALDRAAVSVKKVSLRSDTRNAVLPTQPGPLRQTVAPVAHTTIEVPMAVLCPPQTTCSGSYDFSVRVDPGGQRLVHRHLEAEPDAGSWHSERIDLSPLAGQRISLELDIERSENESGRRENDAVAVWGEPLLVQPPGSPRLNLLLISIDTLRADHLGSYGYGRSTSPELDALAADGVRFAQAISQAPWTTPAHMSLLTSLYPSTHRVNQGWTDFLAFRAGTGHYRTLSHETPTLAEILREHGYRTLALTGRGTMAGALGFDHGFDIYRERRGKLSARRLTELEDWLDQFGNAPFFIFLHTFEVHAPYRHTDFLDGLMTAAEREDLERLIAKRDWPALLNDLPTHLQTRGLFRPEITAALYDGGIRYTDAFLGRLFAALRDRGLYDHTLIVVTSDHGEEFGDHDSTRIYNAHCTTLYDELIHVPLIMRVPGRFRKGTVVAEQVELIDVAPTVLALLGVAPDPAMQGHSQVPLMGGETAAADDLALSETTCVGPEWKALRTSTRKYIMALDVHDGERTGVAGPVLREELFDLLADPGERNSLQEHEPEQSGELREQLNQALRTATERGSPHEPPTAPVTEELRERLRVLGYVK